MLYCTKKIYHTDINTIRFVVNMMSYQVDIEGTKDTNIHHCLMYLSQY
jgi:hypothetical protein